MDRELHCAEHGGNLAEISRRYGISRDRLTDFSANLNPLGPPRSLLRAFARAARDRAILSSYPDTRHAGLVAALARRHDVDAASIVVANGAAALLDAAVRVRPLERCLVPQPAFSEDRRALEAAGVEIVPLSLARENGFRLTSDEAIAALERDSCDGVLVTNPHNPSGTLASRETMARIAAAARARGALTIVDEAFADYAPPASIANVAAREADTIVIRSLTKFFAVPDLRVGYAICEPHLARHLRAILPSWPVSNAIAGAFVGALADRGFARRSRARNARERARLVRNLRERNFEAFESAANFVLVGLPANAPHASEIVARAIVRDRIVLRDCSSYAGLEDGGFVRVAVRTRRENERLVAALMRAVQESSSRESH